MGSFGLDSDVRLTEGDVDFIGAGESDGSGRHFGVVIMTEVVLISGMKDDQAV
jgi:hypothetical protein